MIPGNFLSQVTEAVDPNTSGWTALLNATISLGTGGRNGDGCLAVKSVASGEMRARTVSSYLVTAGVLYEAFADAAGATVPERIGIRWLTAANAEISITWSLSTATASATWHRISVAGVAPAGAVRAHVVVSSTPAAAAVVSNFENAYLGQPIRTLGNLLEFNTESPEVDASGWAVDANCTLARQVPMVQWPADFYLGGGHTLALTVTANGNASIKTAAPAAVTAGTEYIVFCYLNPPTSGAATWIELRFVDAGGSVLSTQRSQLAAPGTGWYRQIGSAVAPAGSVGVVVAIGITGATAAQVVRADAVAVIAASQVNATGLLGTLPVGTVTPFADASFEQGAGTWTVTSGVAVATRSTPWGNMSVHSSYSLKLTSSTATTSAVTSGKWQLGPGAADQPWQLSYDLNVAVAGWTFQDFITWYDASNTAIQTDSATSYTLPSGGWWMNTSSYTAPAGAVSAAVRITVGAPSVGAIVYLDKVGLVQALPQTEIVVDAANALVRLTHRGLTAGQLLTMWRLGSDGIRSLVRGPNGLLDSEPITAETFVIEDYEAPLGVPVSYYSEIRDSSGTLVETAEWTTVTIPFDDINLCWLKDPGNPQRNLMLMVPAGGGPDWARPVDQASYVVKNRANKVTRSNIRNGREGDLLVWTRSDTERKSLAWLLSSGGTLLWQTAPGVGVGNMYVSVGQVAESRSGQDADDAWRTWTLPLVEADMPVTTGVNGSAGRTWQDILSEFGTWSEVRSTFATWEDVFLNRRRAQ